MPSVMKFPNFLLMLLCFSSVLLSSALTPQDGNIASTEVTAVLKTEKEFKVSSTAVTTSTTERNGIIGGRKMALRKATRLDKVQAQGVSRRNDSKKVLAGSNNQVEDKFGGKNRSLSDQKVNCKQTVGRFSAEIEKTAGFVAFNADYGAPRHHPPKNN